MKEILNVYRLNENKSIPHTIYCSIYKQLPECCILIPFNRCMYIIAVGNGNNKPNPYYAQTSPTQKPRVFFTTPLLLNQEIEIYQKDCETMNECMFTAGFEEYIKKRYGAKCQKEVTKYANYIVKFVEESIEIGPL
jgi:hypothetical protein